MYKEELEEFLVSRAYQESTRATYEYRLSRWFAWLGSRDATPQLVHRYLTVSGWSANTCRLAGNAIRSFYRWRYGPLHPIVTLVRLPHDDAPIGRHLERPALARVLGCLGSAPVGTRNRAMIMVMAETGLRASEVAGLELRNLDAAARWFKARAKGGKWREGRYSRETAGAVDAWLEVRPRVARPGVGQVFVAVGGTRPGCRLTRDGMKAIFGAIGARAGIGRFSPHDLRRTMAILYTEQGAPSRWVMEAGGWRDLQMVVRYTRGFSLKEVDRYTFLAADPEIPP